MPSPSMSPTATLTGLLPVVTSTLAAKEIDPIELVFLRTETAVDPSFATTTSGFPSPSISPIASPNGEVSGAKATLEANETDPLVLVFLKTETVVLANDGSTAVSVL